MNWYPASPVMEKLKSKDNEISPHTCQSGCHQKDKKQVLVRVWRKGNPRALLVGMQTDSAMVESKYGVPSKT